MNEFLAQFLTESRELVDQAADDLLELEKSPDDAARFDDVFRAFHTLKGGAGIVEFHAMAEALHCAENVLSAARSGARPVSAIEMENCLACLDQVVEWLDAIESTGELPADADAGVVVARFAQSSAEPQAVPSETSVGDAWVEALRGAHSAAASQASTALRYRPAPDSFYRQLDPVAAIAALPGLLALDIGPRAAWPTLDELDPFSCGLVITALLAASPADAAAALGDEMRHCDVAVLDGPVVRGGLALSALGRELLEAQARLLEDAGERAAEGLIASAGAVAANVLRHLGAKAQAEAIAVVAAEAAAQRAPRGLREAITAALGTLETAPAAKTAAAPRKEGRAQTVRVTADRIDALVRLTGELIIAKNAIGHAVKLVESEMSALAGTLKVRHAALDRLVGELQRSVLAMRVLPLRVVFQRFPRLIREMSAELQKPVTLWFEGEDTEADKAIVEVLVEPLMHVLRNAMDHGIETAPARSAAGKSAVATIRLRAFRQGEHVMLEVTDDGAGIDVARVRQVARERDLFAEEALAAMSDEEVIELIFAPGFSTAAEVTGLSGRGVGMDAVRTAVGRLGGTVEASSVPGQGTTVRFTLPFSVMLTEVMTVEAAGQTFGIPLESVVETIRVPKGSIFQVGAAHAIVLRERTIPLVRLSQALGTASQDQGGETAPVVIARLDGELGALQVDRVGERMEIMLKPFDGLLSGLPGIAGSTLLGDGSVLLILDLKELLQ